MGFEPTTSALGRLHSTTELRPRIKLDLDCIRGVVVVPVLDGIGLTFALAVVTVQSGFVMFQMLF